MNIHVVISSVGLWKNLCQIDFDSEWVESVEAIDDFLKIKTNKQMLQNFVGYSQFSDKGITIPQNNRRWDWVKLLVSQVQEQPIVLKISENQVNVIFQY